MSEVKFITPKSTDAAEIADGMHVSINHGQKVIDATTFRGCGEYNQNLVRFIVYECKAEDGTPCHPDLYSFGDIRSEDLASAIEKYQEIETVWIDSNRVSFFKALEFLTRKHDTSMMGCL